MSEKKSKLEAVIDSFSHGSEKTDPNGSYTGVVKIENNSNAIASDEVPVQDADDL